MSETVKRLASACKISGHYTNHSLHHSSASILHNSDENIPNQAVKEHAGHGSDAIDCYRHSTKALKRKVSKILSNAGDELDEVPKVKNVNCKSSTVSVPPVM